MALTGIAVGIVVAVALSRLLGAAVYSDAARPRDLRVMWGR
jgi:hypothetical protein